LTRKPDHRLHAGFRGDPDDVVDLRKLLDHEDDLFPQLSAEQGEPDVVVVLVAVANDQPVVVVVQREHDHQLGL
jgi:hypothetical protein